LGKFNLNFLSIVCWKLVIWDQIVYVNIIWRPRVVFLKNNLLKSCGFSRYSELEWLGLNSIQTVTLQLTLIFYYVLWKKKKNNFFLNLSKVCIILFEKISNYFLNNMDMQRILIVLFFRLLFIQSIPFNKRHIHAIRMFIFNFSFFSLFLSFSLN
jgi:hypothetical protein